MMQYSSAFRQFADDALPDAVRLSIRPSANDAEATGGAWKGGLNMIGSRQCESGELLTPYQASCLQLSDGSHVLLRSDHAEKLGKHVQKFKRVIAGQRTTKDWWGYKVVGTETPKQTLARILELKA